MILQGFFLIPFKAPWPWPSSSFENFWCSSIIEQKLLVYIYIYISVSGHIIKTIWLTGTCKWLAVSLEVQYMHPKCFNTQPKVELSPRPCLLHFKRWRGVVLQLQWAVDVHVTQKKTKPPRAWLGRQSAPAFRANSNAAWGFAAVTKQCCSYISGTVPVGSDTKPIPVHAQTNNAPFGRKRAPMVVCSRLEKCFKWANWYRYRMV